MEIRESAVQGGMIRKTPSIVMVFFIILGGVFVNTSPPAQADTWWEECGWAFDPSYQYDVIDEDALWSGEVVYDFGEKQPLIGGGATLTIAPGSRVQFSEIQISCGGRVVAQGEETNRIVFSKPPLDESLFSDEYDRACFPHNFPIGMITVDGGKNEEASVFEHVLFREMGLSLHHDGEGCPWIMAQSFLRKIFFPIANATSPIDIDYPAFFFYGGNVQISDSVFWKSAYADIETDMFFGDGEDPGTITVKDTDFLGEKNVLALISNISWDGEGESPYSSHVRFENNYYGNVNGPTIEGVQITEGKSLEGDFTLSGWKNESSHTFGNSVLFLPGIKASKLYKKNVSGGEDQLWLPNWWGGDIEELAMSEDGGSREDVYTKRVLEDWLVPFPGGDIYETFLKQLKGMRGEAIIDDYQAFPYDWRYDVEDVVQDGILYGDGTRHFLVDEIETLARESFTGQVTIVAHSYGGLLAKALAMELERNEKTFLLEKIVFVASPQIGTPLTALSLLYGYEESIPTLMSQSQSRTLARTLPSAYELLPSKKYFENMEYPFIEFLSANTRYKELRDTYGEHIDSYGEFFSFLSGDGDGRERPDKGDVSREETLKENYLLQARMSHERLDNWTPPEDMKVIQIAGWGIDTVSGVKYQEEEIVACRQRFPLVPKCEGSGKYHPIYEPQWTVDGDKVVVTPSALFLSDDRENVERFWVDLYQYNDENFSDRKHKNIFETSPVLDLLSDLLRNSEAGALPQYISTERPADYEDASPRIRVSLHSPLHLHFYDSEGRHTGPATTELDGVEVPYIEEGIPGSTYLSWDRSNNCV